MVETVGDTILEIEPTTSSIRRTLDINAINPNFLSFGSRIELGAGLSESADRTRLSSSFSQWFGIGSIAINPTTGVVTASQPNITFTAGAGASGERLILLSPGTTTLTTYNALNQIVRRASITGQNYGLALALSHDPSRSVYVATSSTVEAINFAIRETITPLDLQLSANVFDENIPLGTTIANLAMNLGNTIGAVQFQLVSGNGGNDNGAFQIIGNQLRTNAAINYESQNRYLIRVRASDGGSFSIEHTFTLLVQNLNEAAILNRQVFYNRSTSTTFGNGTENPINSIDPTKQALLPGQTTTAANYTNYSRGLNGLVVDIANASNLAAISAASFQFAIWSSFPDSNPNFVSFNPAVTVSIFPGGGLNRSDRVKLEFPNNAIQNAWLRVTMLADGNTDLPSHDVFYFGNARFDVSPTSPFPAQQVAINAFDVNAVRARQGQNPNVISNIYDVDRNGVVNAFDVNAVRSGLGVVSLRSFTAPSLMNFGLAFSKNRVTDATVDSVYADTEWLDSFQAIDNKNRLKSRSV